MEKDVRKNKRYLMEWEARGLGHEYNEWRNMRCFGNQMIVFIFILCNIVFDKVEWLFLIRDVDMAYSITLKSYLPFYELSFFFFLPWTKIVCNKTSVGTTRRKVGFLGYAKGEVWPMLNVVNIEIVSYLSVCYCNMKLKMIWR